MLPNINDNIFGIFMLDCKSCI